MAGFQQVIIVGNLGRDPETRIVGQGIPVCNFPVAVNMYSGGQASQGERQEKTVWFRVAAWRELGERCQQYLSKGRQVLVIGTIDVRAYTDQSGQPQATLELTARDVRFLGGREDDSGRSRDPFNDYSSGSDITDIPF
ncbi:MAG: single-stranded DNA-binding protein [Aggregatilineales bacterium]